MFDFILRRFVAIAERIATSRKADQIIGDPSDPYMLRWFVWPRNRLGINCYVHCFLKSDDDRALHTHPWANCSILLRGCYREHTKDGYVDRYEGDIKLRLSGNIAHRIELRRGACWTLFLTGPKYQSWGFLCPQGFVHWRDFVRPENPGEIGKGCNQ